MSLFDDIVHCPLARRILAGNGASTDAKACREVVLAQRMPTAAWHVPEPWNGELSARLLFLSSNPSFDAGEDYPRGDPLEPDPATFFPVRFTGGRAPDVPWVRDLRVRLTNGGYGERAPQYWSEIRNAASDLLGCAPGDLDWAHDIALSEVVHCKSKGNEGVEAALETCTRRFLSALLRESAAKVIVWYGRARSAYRSQLAPDRPVPDTELVGPLQVEGRERYLLFLPAPGCARPRRPRKVLDPAQLKAVRDWLASA